MRQNLAEQLRGVARMLHEHGGDEGYSLIVERVLRSLARLVVDIQPEVRIAAGESLVTVAAMLKPADLGARLLTIVVHLAHNDEAEDMRMTAAVLLNELAVSLGPELCEQFVCSELEHLARDPVFRVRKATALNIDAVCRVVERRRLARELLRPAASFRLQGRSYLDELREDMARGPSMASQLTDLAQDCQQHAVPCAVVVLPVLIAGEDDPGTDILDTVSSAVRDAGLQVVRIDDALDPMPPAQRYVLPGDRHPSAQAHERMAAVLADRLQLPAPTSP